MFALCAQIRQNARILLQSARKHARLKHYAVMKGFIPITTMTMIAIDSKHNDFGHASSVDFEPYNISHILKIRVYLFIFHVPLKNWPARTCEQ